MFFQAQPDFYYPNKNGLKLSKNLFRRVRFRDNLNALYLNSTRYTIQEGETPEIIANKQYGSPDWYWTILLVNNIIDIQSQWPLTFEQLDTSIEKFYGDKANVTKHWETKQIKNYNGVEVLKSGIVVEIYQGTTAQQSLNYFPNYTFSYKEGNTTLTLTAQNVLNRITNREFEYTQNENKKEIFLIKSRFLSTLEEEIKTLFAYDTEYKIDENGVRYSET